MNPGPFLIIRKHFYLPLQFQKLNPAKIQKYLYYLQPKPKTQKQLYLLVLVYFLVVVYFIAFLLLLFALLI